MSNVERTVNWSILFYSVIILSCQQCVKFGLLVGIISARTNFSIDFIVNLGELGRGMLGVQRVDSI